MKLDKYYGVGFKKKGWLKKNILFCIKHIHFHKV